MNTDENKSVGNTTRRDFKVHHSKFKKFSQDKTGQKYKDTFDGTNKAKGEFGVPNRKSKPYNQNQDNSDKSKVASKK